MTSVQPKCWLRSLRSHFAQKLPDSLQTLVLWSFQCLLIILAVTLLLPQPVSCGRRSRCNSLSGLNSTPPVGSPHPISRDRKFRVCFSFLCTKSFTCAPCPFQGKSRYKQTTQLGGSCVQTVRCLRLREYLFTNVNNYWIFNRKMYPIIRHVSTDNPSTRTLTHSIILKVYSYVSI